MQSNTTTPQADIHGHVLLIYESVDQRMKVLADYFADGLANNELCILVVPDSIAHITKSLKPAGLDIKKAVTSGNLRIFEMNKTYLPNGTFAAEYMLSNVADMITEAKAKGYAGIRTAGEMAWVYDRKEFHATSKKYETMVNDLKQVNPEFTGLCMYPVKKGFSDMIDTALHTHPNFIYDGSYSVNPFSKVNVDSFISA